MGIVIVVLPASKYALLLSLSVFRLVVTGAFVTVATAEDGLAILSSKKNRDTVSSSFLVALDVLFHL